MSVGKITPLRVHTPANGGDRCPYPRPFSADFAGCPGFRKANLVVSNSWFEGLGSIVTCQHLVTGSHSGANGRFYPRCALGSADDRSRWLASVSPARLEQLRLLDDEFECFISPYRERLQEAKAAVLAAPKDRDRRLALEGLIADFLAVANHFLGQRADSLDAVGLPVEGMRTLIEEWSSAWSETPLPFGGDDDSATAPASPPSLPAADVVETDAGLSISWSQQGLLVRLQGDIDAANIDGVARWLAVASQAASDLHLDFSAVTFCDVGGLAAVVRCSRQLGPGRHLFVHHLPEHLLRAMRMVGWADLATLRVVGGAEHAGQSSENGELVS